jgi:hypothetical protein
VQLSCASSLDFREHVGPPAARGLLGSLRFARCAFRTVIMDQGDLGILARLLIVLCIGAATFFCKWGRL